MSPTDLPITITFVSVLAISLVGFSAWIGLYRGSVDILRGDGGDPVLFKRIRIHGNLMENAPTFALILGVAEALGLGTTWLVAAVASFLVGRALHVVLYDDKRRGVPMGLTTFPGAFLGLWALTQVWFQ